MTSYSAVKDPKAVHLTIVNLIRSDGSTVAGYYDDRLGNDDSFVEDHAAGVFTDVMGPQGGHDALVNAISADGGVVAGAYLNSSGNSVGFVGSVAAGTNADVTGPSGTYSTLVDAISADGNIVAGYYDDSVGTKGNPICTSLRTESGSVLSSWAKGASAFCCRGRARTSA